MDAKDKENVIKSSQTANLLVQDVQDLVRSKDPLLAEIALEVLEQAVKVEQRLKRIESLTALKT